VVEVADSSLPQDRLTKVAIYAAAAIPEYWLVNLREGSVEVFRHPAVAARRYRDVRAARRGELLDLVSFPGVRVADDDLLPAAV
jgi:Uma2 family endonuclease